MIEILCGSKIIVPDAHENKFYFVNEKMPIGLGILIFLHCDFFWEIKYIERIKKICTTKSTQSKCKQQAINEPQTTMSQILSMYRM
jgi:hypothetical protein